MNLRDFTTIERKLGMQTSDSKHHHAWFVYEGVTVARTKRSHGNNKFVPEDLIRKQLHLDSKQFAELIGCHLKLDGYVKILTEKGIITNPQTPEVAS